MLFRQALALEPNDISYHQVLADLFESEGRNEEAFAMYRPVVQPGPSAGSTAEHDPYYVGRYLKLAAKAGHPDQVQWAKRRILTSAHARNADFPALTDAMVAALPDSEVDRLTTLAAAWSHISHEDHKEAEATIDRLVRDYPDFALARKYQKRIRQSR